MKVATFRAAIAALILAEGGAVCQAAPSFSSSFALAVKAAQADPDNPSKPYYWFLPSIIKAGLVPRGISFTTGETFASFESRSIDIQQAQLQLGVSDQVELFYGKHWTTAKGAHGGNFDVSDDYYGGRVVVKRPTTSDPTAWSLQYEAIRPDTAVYTGGGNTVTLGPTQNNVFSVNFQDRLKTQYQLQYTDTTLTGGYYAHVYSLGVGRDYDLSKWVVARLQGNLIGENYQAQAESSDFELRPIVYGAIAFNPTPWVAIEGDVTVLPFGMPLAGGDFTGLSSFDLYSPGGVVGDLRSDFVGLASLRIVFHGKF